MQADSAVLEKRHQSQLFDAFDVRKDPRLVKIFLSRRISPEVEKDVTLACDVDAVLRVRHVLTFRRYVDGSRAIVIHVNIMP